MKAKLYKKNYLPFIGEGNREEKKP